MMRFVGIDPATTTGLVVLDEQGNVLIETELKGRGKSVKGGITDEQLEDLGHQLYKHLENGDEILMEDAAPGTQRGITTGMIHGVLRYMIRRKALKPNFVAPAAVKKFVGVTGWVGEPGNKRRLVDKEKKAAIKQAVLEHFGYTHKSDNVIDAYIIARISLNLYLMREYKPLLDALPYQIEVVESILNKA